MAENDIQQNPAAQPGSDSSQQRFGVQRVYIKDVSFEAPDTPDVFRRQYNPQVNFSINNRSYQIEDGIYEVVLRLTADVKQDDKTVFLVEIEQAGILKSAELKVNSLSKYLL